MFGLTTVLPAQAGPRPLATPQADLTDQLAAIPGVTVVSEGPPPAPGYRFFILTYRQPVDHRDPQGARSSSGSSCCTATPRGRWCCTPPATTCRRTRSGPSRRGCVDGNQISVEQRFFTPSRPDPANWRKLDIWQAATDHHRIVDALKTLYSAKWISTGASKGGMTSVYHRRFYPRDVDGVVAYVAPNDANNKADSAYDEFFDRSAPPRPAAPR